MNDRIARTAYATLAGVLLALMLAPAIASACNYPSLGLSKSTAGPGDSVAFTIADAQPGAQYTLTIAGREVASGTSSSANGHSGSFQMPDLGSSQRVSVDLVATHAGPDEPGHETGPWRDSEVLAFAMPVKADAPVQESVAAPGPTAQAQAPAARQAETATAPVRTADARDPGPVRNAGTRNPQRAPATRPQARRDVTQTARRTSAAAADVPRRAIATPAAVVRSSTGEETKRSAPSKAHGGRAPVADSPPVAAARAPVPGRALPVAQADPLADTQARDRPSVLLLVGLALLLGVLGHAAAAAARLRRAVPVPPPTAVRAQAQAYDIEAELQQLLASATSRAPDEAERSERSEAVAANTS